VDGLVDALDEVVSTVTGTFEAREKAALELANEVVRRWTERDLARVAARYGEEVVVDGERYRRHAAGTRKYHSLCGPIAIRRDTYRLVGVHNGRTVVPLELEAGIVANATPALASSAIQAFAMMPLRDYEGQMRAAFRMLPARSTLERICKRTGAKLEQARIIEHVVRSAELLPAGARSISIGLDRTTIPMAEMQQTSRPRKTSAHVRRRPLPVHVVYRMAYVGTIAVHDADGNALATTRVSSTADTGAVPLMKRLCLEVQHLLDQRSLPIVVVQDGAPELWNLIGEWLKRFGITPTMKLIDRYHVEERLAQVAAAVEPDPTAARVLLENWRSLLDRSDAAIRRIHTQIGLRLYARRAPPPPPPPGALLPWPAELCDTGPPEPFDRSRKVLHGDAAQVAEANLRYFERPASLFRYATARKRGFAIGSGVTEGSCKSVIATRFKRSGQRWFDSGASPCLHLRTMHLNARLRPSFQLLVDKERHRLGHA
jgi:hypothetical protein